MSATDKFLAESLASDEARPAIVQSLQYGLQELFGSCGGRPEKLSATVEEGGKPWPKILKVHLEYAVGDYESPPVQAVTHFADALGAGVTTHNRTKGGNSAFVSKVEDPSAHQIDVYLRGESYSDIFSAVNFALKANALPTIESAMAEASVGTRR